MKRATTLLLVPPALALAATVQHYQSRKRQASCVGVGAAKVSAVGATYPANNPIEDRHVVGKQCANGWSLHGVLDGHGGWQVSEFAHSYLVQQVEARLKMLPLLENTKKEKEEVDEILLDAFAATEQCYLEQVRSAYKAGFGEVAKVGSCVLLALRKQDTLVLANLGDCRAVLGSSVLANATNTGNDVVSSYHVATRLTHDHNARVPSEVIALQTAHPDEQLHELVRCKSATACYVKGRLQLTRALGDLYLKYHEFNAKEGAHRSSGRHIPAPYSPPYVNAVPELTRIRLDPSHDRFLILASDGLWDFLSDQQACNVVSHHLAKGDEQGAAAALVEQALRVAASECEMTLSELKALPQGSKRRNRHDDTTAVVVFF